MFSEVDDIIYWSILRILFSSKNNASEAVKIFFYNMYNSIIITVRNYTASFSSTSSSAETEKITKMSLINN